MYYIDLYPDEAVKINSNNITWLKEIPATTELAARLLTDISSARDIARRALSCASESCEPIELLPRFRLPYCFLIVAHLCMCQDTMSRVKHTPKDNHKSIKRNM